MVWFHHTTNPIFAGEPCREGAVGGEDGIQDDVTGHGSRFVHSAAERKVRGKAQEREGSQVGCIL